MTYRTSLSFDLRWRNVKERRRDRLSDWICDLVYLVSGFHL